MILTLYSLLFGVVFFCLLLVLKKIYQHSRQSRCSQIFILNPFIKMALSSSTSFAWHSGIYHLLQLRHYSIIKTVLLRYSFEFYQQWSCPLKEIGQYLRKYLCVIELLKEGVERQWWWDGEDSLLMLQGPELIIFISIDKIMTHVAHLAAYSVPVWESKKQRQNNHLLLCWRDEYPPACSAFSQSPA